MMIVGIHPLSAAEWSGEVETKLERLMGLPKEASYSRGS